MDYHQVESVVETKDRLESLVHSLSGRRVQSPKIGSNDVKFEAVALGYPRDVPAQWFVRGTIRQEERARRHASVKEI